MSNAIEQKKLEVAAIREKLERAQSVVLVDYRGLTVAEVTELRNLFRAQNVEYQVLKNTLVRRAANDLGITGLDDVLNGPTALAFSMENPGAGAKVLRDFAAKTKKSEVKAGLLGTEVLDKDGVKALADLPSKEELIAKMMGSLNAPITNFVGVLSAVLRNFVYALDAVRKKKEEGAA